MVEAARGPAEMLEMLAPVAENLDAVGAWMDARFAEGPAVLQPLLAHAARFRGKRLRAAQVLLVARACGEVREEHVAVAGIIEMIHAATLVHDDLLDEATERRGLDCMHVEWGPHAAVLLGDWIYASAFRASTDLEDQTCSRELSEATARVCAGEIHQNLTRRDFALSASDYYAQIDGKTAALFASGGRLAAHYAGATSAMGEAAARHGLLAGRAFQVADDLLDLEGDPEAVGKSLGTDWARGKMTLPLILLRDALDAPARARMEELFASGAEASVLREDPFGAAYEKAAAATRAETSRLLDDAAAHLSDLPDRETADRLARLTRYLGSRDR